MIRCIIVEDELKSRETLVGLLERFCPDVMVVAQATGVQSAREMIQKHRPDLVFLDIEMPDGSGFRLLEYKELPEFVVIFTTAFDQFAIKAIRYAALDYLLKPIVPEELMDAVEKVRMHKEKESSMKNYEVLLSNLKSSMSETRKIVLSTLEKKHVVDVDSILRCESDNYYTHFYFTNGKHLLISKTLKDVEAMLEGGSFIRPHKSHLINTRHIQNFIREEGGMITLSNGDRIPVSRRKKEKILEIIHNL
ncbi:MAG: LytTR family DNA-binding domain-containing protein [Bacteroidales bacterium]|jgi:two-component system LytT family response regulator|nr:LytTR family DNA-binding domain-containing protein [Bacteroidales bacterium]MCK9448007.1 LytTR family DNA-binding domain-containing protein [Bacteroidales bacterium]MDD3701068.1 LytTR family DNA-binding domain-containing protein [Bacteroidales bacterium]MDY0369294.1 LytTR family DNA-binding domain-containing protein [Bacteroidales bacterium]